MKQFRLTIILLAVVVALGAYVWLFERGQTRTATAWKFDTSDIQRIELTSGKKTTVVERRDRSWRITEPIAAPVDGERMNELLNRVAKVEVHRRIEKPEKLKGYGLAPASARITIALSNGRSRALYLGSKTPDGAAVYAVAQANGQVVLVDLALLDDAIGGAALLRDRHALPFVARDLREIVVARPGGRVALEKRGKYWRIAAPIKVSADPAAVANFLAALGNLEASRFAAERPSDLSRYGLKSPRLSITLTAGGTPRRLAFGASTGTGEYYAQNNVDPAVMAVSRPAFDGVNKALTDLRSKRIAAIDVDNVERIAVARGGQRFELIRAKDKRWIVASPVRMDADSGTVENLLWALSDLRARAFVDAPQPLAQYGLDPPRAAVTVWEAQRQEPVRIWFGGPTPSSATPSVYAKAGGPTIYVVPAGVLRQLPASASALRSLTLVSYEPGAITRVQATFDGRTIALQRSGTTWNLTAPQKRRAKPERVDELLGLVENVRARAFVRDSADAGLPDWGSDPGSLKLTIDADKRKPTTLGVREIEGATYLKLEGQNAVFRGASGSVKELKDALVAVSRDR